MKVLWYIEYEELPKLGTYTIFMEQNGGMNSIKVLFEEGDLIKFGDFSESYFGFTVSWVFQDSLQF